MRRVFLIGVVMMMFTGLVSAQTAASEHRGYGYGFGYRPYYSRFGYYGYRGHPFYYGWHDPWAFGPYGYGYDTHSYTVFTSFLDLDIRRTADGQALFEGLAQARSRSNALPELVPNLVEAMFTGFPGNSGETVRITVAPERGG